MLHYLKFNCQIINNITGSFYEKLVEIIGNITNNDIKANIIIQIKNTFDGKGTFDSSWKRIIHFSINDSQQFIVIDFRCS